MQPDWTPEHLDTPAELLAERFGVSVFTATEILRWHEAEQLLHVEQTASAMGGAHLHRILAWMLGPGDAKAKAVALCFAADLQPLIGWTTLAEAADELGMTSANLSKLQTEIQAWLELPENQWNKTKFRCRQHGKPITKELPTVERVAQSFRRWLQRVDVEALTAEQKALVKRTLSGVVEFAETL